jgi:hypothetical protein
VLIRGSASHAGTSVEGGISENESPPSKVSSKSQGDVMVDRAISLIDGLMTARNFYKGDEFVQDVVRKIPLSMQWYNYIFSCSMQFRPGSIERYKAPEDHSRHIIVMVRGNIYKVDLICSDEEGREKRMTGNKLKVSDSSNDMVSQKNLTPPLKPRDYTPLVVLTTVT